MKLLMATGNPGKVEELTALLAPFGVELVCLKDLALPADCPETGESFLENSKQKAFYYQRLSGLPVVADDSGLEVDALGGAPGIHSARFGGLETHMEKRRYLLDLLKSVEPEYRTARFCCAAVFFDGRTYLSAEATIEGF
ncbi:MAG: non-canonical purine NTP pyrophosphatase, partial [Acidobacteria bacterium]|nr:non-canonical purine NTP pyrophosphatase [Acidobacteriota bacterium]